MANAMDYRGSLRLVPLNKRIAASVHVRDSLAPLVYDLPDRKILIDCMNNHGNVERFDRVTSQYFHNLLNDLPRISDSLIVDITEESLVIRRGSLYMRGAYYSLSDEGVTFATDKKALVATGADQISRIETGQMFSLTAEGAETRPYHPLTRPSRIQEQREPQIIETLRRVLVKSFQALESMEVGVLFSGGVDSGLVAHLAGQNCTKTTLYSVSAADSRDATFAKRAAELLGMRHVHTLIDDKDTWHLLPEVIYAIEDSNRMNVSIALPFLVASRTAKADGLESLLSGQGPDELFAGYARHVKILESGGPDALETELWNEVSVTHKANLERDEKAVAYGGCDIIFPYLNIDFVNTALSIDVAWKIRLSDPPIRKYIFRRVAKEFGLPDEIAEAQKSATQFSSRSDRLIVDAVYRYIGRPNGLSKRESNRLTQTVLDRIANEMGFSHSSYTDAKTVVNESIDWTPVLDLVRDSSILIPRLSGEER